MIKTELENEIRKAVKKLYGDTGAEISVSRSEKFGDYAANAALILSKELKKGPIDVAGEIKEELQKSSSADKYISNIEIASPGFINITVGEEAVSAEISSVNKTLQKGFDFLKKEKINVEFISANPTGDLHIGHGRGAFYGDILSNTLSYAGAKVDREFYINDSRESKQIMELGRTALGTGDQYKTEKLEELIGDSDFSDMDEKDAGFALAEKIQKGNQTFVEDKLRIDFDVWYSEDKKIRKTKAGDKILEKLKKTGAVYEKDGAVWLKTSEYGDNEDRVIVRSDLTKSYFLTDITYHDEKFGRRYSKVIDVWGADHHGHIKRMYATGKILKWPEGQPVIFVTQLVSLKEAGKRKKMSKRAGTAVLLEELVDEFGIDVVRWFFAEKSLGTHIDFDAELAREQSAKNPVYYVQYAHARISSVERNTKNLKDSESTIVDSVQTKEGRKLAMKILEFPEIIEDITKDCQVHKLTTYAYELAQEFSQFYRDVRVIDEETYNSGALELSLVAKNVLAKTLGLLGISAPEKM